MGQEDITEETLRFDESKEKDKREDQAERRGTQNNVDYTPPELITALVTETGVHTPSAVSEELIKIWY